MPLPGTISEVMQRLIRRLDHRWKKDGELPEEAETYTFLHPQATQAAEIWELVSDLRSLNDIELISGVPLDFEAADLGLVRLPGWSDEDLRWWIKLHWMLYVSGGTIPQIKQLVSYLLRRNTDDANQLFVHTSCSVCLYKEPAFYTIQFPVSWLVERSGYFVWDADVGNELTITSSGGWDNGLWGDEPEESILYLLRFLSKATIAGVRINAECYGGLMFDPDDEGDSSGKSEAHGWDSSQWNGAIVEAVQAYGISQLELDKYHVCVPGATDWENLVVPDPAFKPRGLLFDPSDSDDYHRSIIYGWDYAAWLDSTSQET